MINNISLGQLGMSNEHRNANSMHLTSETWKICAGSSWSVARITPLKLEMSRANKEEEKRVNNITCWPSCSSTRPPVVWTRCAQTSPAARLWDRQIPPSPRGRVVITISETAADVFIVYPPSSSLRGSRGRGGRFRSKRGTRCARSSTTTCATDPVGPTKSRGDVPASARREISDVFQRLGHHRVEN